jgi:hypothetical protein
VIRQVLVEFIIIIIRRWLLETEVCSGLSQKTIGDGAEN